MIQLAIGQPSATFEIGNDRDKFEFMIKLLRVLLFKFVLYYPFEHLLRRASAQLLGSHESAIEIDAC